MIRERGRQREEEDVGANGTWQEWQSSRMRRHMLARKGVANGAAYVVRKNAR
jgi:hypothetical protein